MLPGVERAADAHRQLRQAPADVVAARFEANGLLQDEKGAPLQQGSIGLFLQDEAELGDGVGVVRMEAEVALQVVGGLGEGSGVRGGVAGLLGLLGMRPSLIGACEQDAGVASHLKTVQEMEADGEERDGDEEDGQPAEPQGSAHGASLESGTPRSLKREMYVAMVGGEVRRWGRRPWDGSGIQFLHAEG